MIMVFMLLPLSSIAFSAPTCFFSTTGILITVFPFLTQAPTWPCLRDGTIINSPRDVVSLNSSCRVIESSTGAIGMGTSLSCVPYHPSCFTVQSAGLLNPCTPATVTSLLSSASLPSASSQPPPHPPMSVHFSAASASSSQQVSLACEGLREGWTTWALGRFYVMWGVCSMVSQWRVMCDVWSVMCDVGWLKYLFMACAYNTCTCVFIHVYKHACLYPLL